MPGVPPRLLMALGLGTLPRYSGWGWIQVLIEREVFKDVVLILILQQQGGGFKGMNPQGMNPNYGY